MPVISPGVGPSLGSIIRHRVLFARSPSSIVRRDTPLRPVSSFTAVSSNQPRLHPGLVSILRRVIFLISVTSPASVRSRTPLNQCSLYDLRPFVPCQMQCASTLLVIIGRPWYVFRLLAMVSGSRYIICCDTPLAPSPLSSSRGTLSTAAHLRDPRNHEPGVTHHSPVRLGPPSHPPCWMVMVHCQSS